MARDNATITLDRDMAAYRQTPPTTAELALADVSDGDLGDDTDWEALYADEGADDA